MAATRDCLVVDLGAESGRAVLGKFDGSRLVLEDVHRFPNGPVRLRESIYWDTLRLFSEIKHGISSAVREHRANPGSIGIDTWGVDFGLLDRRGELIGNPYHYRDRRCDGMLEAAFKKVPQSEIFEQTGIQFMQINTLYQLLAMVLEDSPALAAAQTILLMPDLFSYWLTGAVRSERSIASTSQCLDPIKGTWALTMLERLGIPGHIFPDIIEPGTILGPLLRSVAEETGVEFVQVIAGGSHDTASAVAAVPARTNDYAYLSSGTWSLMGVELPGPVINAKALAYNFTNEGGVCGTIRLLKNITGLWLIQECRRTWEAEGISLTYEEIARLAAETHPSTAFVDPDYPDFMAPGNMPGRLRAFCNKTGQRAPETIGSLARLVFESLALKYRLTLERLEELAGKRLATIHIVGGGSKNRLLSQLTADVTGRTVVAGPVEATAAGNALMQLIALRELGTIEDGRSVIWSSFPTETYEPLDTQRWEETYRGFLRLLKHPALTG